MGRYHNGMSHIFPLASASPPLRLESQNSKGPNGHVSVRELHVGCCRHSAKDLLFKKDDSRSHKRAQHVVCGKTEASGSAQVGVRGTCVDEGPLLARHETIC